MNLGFAILAIGVLWGIVLLGSGGAAGNFIFGIFIPYAALISLAVGFVCRVVRWAKSPVPFRIPTTCGQQKTLPWIKSAFWESPHNAPGVIGRMALEVLFFRSLFRNSKVEIREGKPVFGGARWLWLFGLGFHWSLLVIVLRHLRFFTEPVPLWVNLLVRGDGILEIGLPTLYLTDALFLTCVAYLFLRRVAIPQLRYISLPADYFPLLLILSIGLTGFLMRHLYKVDLHRVKEMALGLIHFRPQIGEGLGPIFYLHLFLASVLLAYIPMSKLAHMGGVFLSPTRNLANDSRMRRHINPWNYPVKVHPYEEYEDEFREKMKGAGIPVEKE